MILPAPPGVEEEADRGRRRIERHPNKRYLIGDPFFPALDRPTLVRRSRTVRFRRDPEAVAVRCAHRATPNQSCGRSSASQMRHMCHISRHTGRHSTSLSAATAASARPAPVCVNSARKCSSAAGGRLPRRWRRRSFSPPYSHGLFCGVEVRTVLMGPDNGRIKGVGAAALIELEKPISNLPSRMR